VFILKRVKVVCFVTLLQVLILKVVKSCCFALLAIRGADWRTTTAGLGEGKPGIGEECGQAGECRRVERADEKGCTTVMA